MKYIVYTIFWTLLTSIIGMYLGLISGMVLTEFTSLSLHFGDMVGYEANGFLFSLLGLSLGSYFGSITSQRIVKEKGHKLTGIIFTFVGFLFNLFFSQAFVHFLFPVTVAIATSLYGFYIKNMTRAFLKMK